MGTPHDVLFRAAFAEPRVALEWLRSVVPAAVAEILDWSTLAVAREETVGLKLSLHVADLAFEVKGVDGALRVAIVVEHKSAASSGTHDQMLRYTVLRKHWFRKRDKQVPPVVPIVLQHGASGVTEGQTACMPAELEALQPQLRLLVDDLRTVTEEQIRARGLHPLATLVLLALRTLPQVGSVDAALAALARWQDLIAEELRDEGPPNPTAMLEALGWYVLYVTDMTEEQLPMELKPPQDSQGVVRMTTGQRIWSEGRAAGRSEGKSEGKTEEARLMLGRLLQRRFDVDAAAAEARLQGATLEQLEAWVDRILDAESIDALFAER